METIAWHDVQTWGIEGKAFDDTESYFDRLPARARGAVRPEVWDLSRHSAGMIARFETDAPEIHLRYSLTNSSLASKHMPATGVSGVDLYANENGTWRWMETHQPDAMEVEKSLVSGIDPGLRQYLMNLPLYNGVKRFEIGVPSGSTFNPVLPRKEKLILFYGTSITQGACASRPGSCYTSILGRRLNRPLLNFGFSGNGKMEVEVAQFLVEIDPVIFVIENLPNMSGALVEERAKPLVKLIRKERPKTPILLLEDRTRPESRFILAQRKDHEAKRAALRKAYQELIAEGISGLHYQKAVNVLGTDNEGTVDGSHPTDLGMMRYAEALEPQLREIIS